MKLLHVSDWHLGRVLYNVSRTHDHDRVLAEIIALARAEAPDLVVHTGDLFESVRPAYDDMDRAITALRELGSLAPVVVLAGNHDSPALFRLFADLVGPASPVRFIDRARLPSDGGVLRFEARDGTRVRLAVLPFVHQHRTVEAFEDPNGWMVAYADRVQRIEQTLWEGLCDGHDPSRDVLLLAAHLHMAGASFSESERPLHITETYATRADSVPDVAYAAFGHIHRPQVIPGLTPGRYAGSPIALDFGEMGQQKSVVLVEARPGEPAVMTAVPISGGRPLRKLEGTLTELRALASEAENALCLVTVKTQTPVPDLSDQVREILEDATLLEVRESCDARRVAVLDRASASTEEPTFEEMLREYLADVGTKTAPAEAVLSTFHALLGAVEREERATFAEEHLADEPQVPRTA